MFYSEICNNKKMESSSPTEKLIFLRREIPILIMALNFNRRMQIRKKKSVISRIFVTILKNLATPVVISGANPDH